MALLLLLSQPAAVHYSASFSGRTHPPLGWMKPFTNKKKQPTDGCDGSSAADSSRPLGAHPAGPSGYLLPSATIRRPSRRSGANDPVTSIK